MDAPTSSSPPGHGADANAVAAFQVNEDSIEHATQLDAQSDDEESTDDNQLYDLGCPSETVGSFAIRKDAQEFAEQFAAERGFVIVQRGGSDKTRLKLKCDKGDSHHAKAARTRESSSRQTSCTYRLNVRLRADKRWHFVKAETNHTHPATTAREMSVHSRVRLHLTTEAQRTQMRDLAAAAIPPRKILQLMRKAHPDSCIDRRDIANLAASARLEELNGRTPTNALVDTLAERGAFYRV
jgi:acyl-CoA thioesterase